MARNVDCVSSDRKMSREKPVDDGIHAIADAARLASPRSRGASAARVAASVARTRLSRRRHGRHVRRLGGAGRPADVAFSRRGVG
jgi:hypothetical protein